MSTGTDKLNKTADIFMSRVNKLVSSGYNFQEAADIAALEDRINSWPKEWGKTLQVVIYGDFLPPEQAIEVSSLGIVVHPERLEEFSIQRASCALKATIAVKEKTHAGLIDAMGRINFLLGANVLANSGRGPCGWWSNIFHGLIPGGGALSTWNHIELQEMVSRINSLPKKVSQRVKAALSWIRNPQMLMIERRHKNNILHVYSGYWNAFECLVEAMNIVSPMAKRSKAAKQQLLNEWLATKKEKLTPNDIQQCYQTIVNPGFVAKASHAFNVCFEQTAADTCISECFKLPDEQNRLYDIRNAINHGNIDAESVNELSRVELRYICLYRIVLGMFDYFIAPKQHALDKLN